MMDLGRLRRLHELFGEADGLADDAFAAFVHRVRATDAEMANELLELRREVQRGGGDEADDEPALEALVGPAALRVANEGLARLAADPLLSSAPTAIEGFRLLRRIGEGGMGIVFEAEQDAPRRRVAIKLMHPSPGTERLRRFELEAAVLGRLHHPHIAQIHAYGTHRGERGDQPWFAMELVDGVDLRTHSERARLDIAARLVLFCQVVDAVHHAHERGVVHRDLKPDNVLVDSRGAPKVLDFGVARANDSSLDLASMATKAGDLIGTLAYMAPEQLAAKPDAITARSDVYSLGVMLYELLAGRRPHEIASLPIAAAVHVLTTQPAVPLARSDARLRGDLATIVGKAMESDPARRYATAADLAGDIRRHLDRRPIQARPASVAYRFTTMLRRNRALATGLIAAFAALAFGLGGMTWLAHRASVERDRARRETYSANVIGAGDALARSEFAAARAYLEAAPEELRGWEWRVLLARLDTSIDVNVRSIPNLDKALLELVPVGDGSSYWLLDHSATGVREKWDRASGRELGRIEAALGSAVDGKFVHCVLEKGDAPRVRVVERDVVTGSVVADRTAILPEVARRACEHDGHWYCPDGRFVWAPIERGIVRIDLDERLPPASLEPFAAERYLERVAIQPGGKLMAITTEFIDPVVLVEIEPLRVIAQLPGHTNTVTSMSFSRDGSLLVTTSGDQTARVWDVTTVPPTCRLVLQHPLEVPNAAFSPDHRLLATTCLDRMLRVFRIADGALVGTFGSSSLLTRPVAFFDDATLAGVESDGTVRFWNIDAPATTVFASHRAPVERVTLVESLGLVVSAGVEGFRGLREGLHFHDIDTGDLVAEYLADGSVARGVEVAADGTTLHLQTANLAERLRVRQWTLDLRTGVRRELATDQARTAGFGLSPKGDEIAVVDGALHVVDAVTGESRRRGAPAPFAMQRLHWSRDGRWILGMRGPGSDLAIGTAVMFDAQTLAETRRFADGSDFAFAVTGDDHRLATAGADGVVRVFDIESGELLAELRGHDLAVFCLAWSPDGTRLASSGHDRGIRLWDAATFDPVARLSGHEDTVMDLSWNGDDRLVSCGHDDVVRIWESAPLRTRFEARTARQLAVARLQPRIDAMFAELHDAGRVFDRIAADGGLGAADRRVAHQLALRIALARSE